MTAMTSHSRRALLISIQTWCEIRKERFYDVDKLGLARERLSAPGRGQVSRGGCARLPMRAIVASK